MKSLVSIQVNECYKQSGIRSIRAYAKYLDIPEGTLRDVMVKGSQPRAEFIAKFIEKNPWLSTEWLLTGNGPMKKEDIVASSSITAENSIVGDGNTHNHIEAKDDAFWKDLVTDLRATIADLRKRCGTLEEANSNLEKALEEEKSKNPLHYVCDR